MKRILSILMTFAMIFSMTGTLSFGTEMDRTDRIKWLDDNYKVERIFGLRGFGSGLIIVKKDGKYGAIDWQGEEIVPFKYKYPMVFYGELAKVNKRNGRAIKYGYINTQGKEIVPMKYTKLGEFKDGLALAKKDDKFGYIDMTGKDVIPFKFAEAEPFSEGMAVVVFENLGDKTSSVEPVSNEKKYVYIDKNGNTPIKESFVIADNFSEGLALVKLDYSSKIQYMNKKGEIVIDTEYTDGKGFAEGMAPVMSGEMLDGKWGFIDKKGREVIKPKYSGVDSFKDGIATVLNGDFRKKDVKYGLINKKGKEVLPVEYDRIKATKNGYIFKKDGKYGYLHKDGTKTGLDYDKIVIINGKTGVTAAAIGTRERYLSMIDGSTVLVEKDGVTGYIDDLGKIHMPPKGYKALISRDGKVELIVKNRKFGYSTNDGNKILIKPSFIFGTVFNDGMAVVEKNGKIGVIDEEVLFAEHLSNDDNVQAIASNMPVEMKGKKIDNLEIYNIDGNNYFKLRDIAKLSMGTKTEFSINWDAKDKVINVKTDGKYKPVGQELLGIGDGTKKYGVKSNAKIKINGKAKRIKAYNIAGNNYYKLRDLGKALDFKVDWEPKTRTVKIAM